MKKILVSLLVLALCAPAMADVVVDVANNGDGSAEVTMVVSGGATVRGLALSVVCTGGAQLADLTYGTPDAGLNTFIDYFALNGVGEVTGETPAQEGHPYADDAGPGVAAPGDTEFSICIGALDATGAQGGLGDGTYTIATIQTGAGNVCVDADTLRAGIVGDNLGTVTAADCADITDGPECWNYPCHPDGDYNGDDLITAIDVQALVAAWPPNAYDECADFSQDGVITAIDVQRLVAVWGIGCP